MSGAKAVSEWLQAVLAYIEDHLHEDIRLDELAAVSHLSKYHFARMFASSMGESPMAYVNARRLVRSLRLLAETDSDMTDIALSCGFGSLSAFHNAFKKKYRMTPGDYRKSQRYNQNRKIRNKTGNFQQAFSAGVRYADGQQGYLGKIWRMNVAIVTLPPYETASIRHVGSYLESFRAWEKLRAWIARSGMPTEKAIYIGIPLDDPETDGEHACRYDACVTLPPCFAKTADPDIVYQVLPGGDYGLYKFYDTVDRLGIIYQGLLHQWLPTSEYEWDDSRHFLEITMNHPAEDPDGRSKIDLYIPVRRKKREGEIGMARHPFVPELYFDGQRVDVLWDNYDNAIAWFKQYFGWDVKMREAWKVDPSCREGWMTQMNHGTWMVTYLADVKLPHHHADRGGAEANVRLCFRVQDLEKLREAFQADGIRVSDIYDGPKTRYFDVWATAEGIRLTLQEDADVAEGVHPSWVRIGVRDLEQAIKWQQNVTGMRLLERDPQGRFAVMALGLNHAEGEDSLWVLEQLPEDAHTGKVNGQVQPVCWVKSRDAFFKYHHYLKSIGVDTSEIGGFVARGMVGFHFYDPDGNRFNISSM